MAGKKLRSTDDILAVLCKSVQKILSNTTASKITYSPTVQKINKTCLKPDIGCFVLFEGAFSGIVIINMSGDAAVEIYQNYMRAMGMPPEEISDHHTQDDVGNMLGELMNQIVGDFQGELEHQFMVSIKQTQPKMLVVNRELILSINANIDRPQSRRVIFRTQKNKTFYVEMSMEKVDFFELDIDPGEDGQYVYSPDLSKDEKNKAFLDDLDL